LISRQRGGARWSATASQQRQCEGNQESRLHKLKCARIERGRAALAWSPACMGAIERRWADGCKMFLEECCNHSGASRSYLIMALLRL
jgi:hypothetical protein